MNTNVQFAKIYPDAKIPTMRNDNMGLDVYVHFDKDYFVLEPHESFVFGTGIVSACDPSYGFVLKDNNILAQYGVTISNWAVSSEDRNDWHIVLTNTSDSRFVISKLSDIDTYKAMYPNATIEYEYRGDGHTPLAITGMPMTTFIYKYSKPVAQVLVVPVHNVEVEEVSCEDILAIPGSHF